MRAIYLENIQNLKSGMDIPDEKIHHLNNVLRAKTGEIILLLDGCGRGRKAIIENITKRKIDLKFLDIYEGQNRLKNLTVAIGQTKKDAFDLSLKQLVEIGIEKIIILESEYSQKFELKKERIEKVLISALEQSNAFYLPELTYLRFNEFVDSNKNKIIYFSSIGTTQNEIKYDSKEEYTILLGPEGGYSLDEEELVKKMTDSVIINLPTNILRTSTAVSFCTGYFLGKS